MKQQKRLKLIACEVMFREICLCAAGCKQIIDIEFMPKGLHDIGEARMSERLQAEIDKADPDKYDAILLCYGLCNNGVRGLHARLPIIIPRAHDCITLLLGSRDRYADYFQNNPGTFFKSPGWIERDTNPDETQDSVTSQLGMNKTYQEYVENYGEENAKYLMEMLGDWTKNYRKITYIDTAVRDAGAYREIARQQAEDNQWEYEEIDGDTGLIYRLLNGDWNDREFLIVPADKQIRPTSDEDIVGCC